jgi:hypothetical protein
MSVTYNDQNTRLNRFPALKLMPEDFAEPAQWRDSGLWSILSKPYL